MGQEVLTMKSEMAEKYVEDFKKELDFLEKAMMWPLEDGLKEAMLNDIGDVDSFKELEGLGWWKHIFGINTVLSNRVLEFVKEKQELLALANTREDLKKLKDGIVPKHEKDEEDEKDEEADDNTNESSEESKENDVQDSESEDTNKKTEGSDEDGSYREGVAYGIGAGGVAAHVTAAKSIEDPRKLRNISESIDINQSQRYFSNTANKLRLRSKHANHTWWRRNNMRKMADKFDEAAKKIADGKATEALGLRNKIGTVGLSPEELKSIGMNGKVVSDLKKLTQLDEFKNLSAEEFIAMKRSRSLSNFFEKHGLGSISGEAFDILNRAENLSDFKNMTKVLSQSKDLRFLARVARSGMFLDLAFIGVDVWFYSQDMHHAKKIANEYRRENAENRAKMHLYTGIATGVASGGVIAAGSLMAAGPPGWVTGVIVGAIGGVAMGVDQFTDSMYFDVLNFYGQNMQDYILQYRTEVKSAILQLSHTNSGKNLSMNEKFTQWWEGSEILGRTKIGEKDAWKALIYLDEDTDSIIELEMRKKYYRDLIVDKELSGQAKVDMEEKIEDLQSQIDERNKKIMPRLETRMQYVEKKTKNKNISTQSELLSILADSKIFYAMKETQKENPNGYITQKCNSIAEYKETYREKLIAEDKEFFDILSNLYKKEPYQFMQLYEGTMVWLQGFNSLSDMLQREVLEESGGNLKKRAIFYKHFFEFKHIGVEHERTLEGRISGENVHGSSLENFLQTGEIDIENTGEQQARSTIWMDEGGSEILTDSSPYLGQNILYRLAREYHGYGGGNTMQELIDFYKKSKANALGIYYGRTADNWHAQWQLNRDSLTVDAPLPITRLNQIKEVKDPKRLKNKIFRSFGFKKSNGEYIPKPRVNNRIDTSTESVDEQLNKSFYEVMYGIINEEVDKKTPQYRKRTEQKIVDFVEKQSKKGGYIRIPNYLIREARSVDIGDLSNGFAKYIEGTGDKKGKITFLMPRHKLNKIYDLKYVDIPVDFETLEMTRKKLTPGEKKLVNSVDIARNKLEYLRSRVGNFSGHQDEFDIPIEYERMISQKSKDREELKRSLLNIPTGYAKERLERNYKEYLQYFRGMYFGLLKNANEAWFSNDADNVGTLEMVRSRTRKDLVTVEEDGSYEIADGALNEEQEELFNEMIDDNEILFEDPDDESNKTIRELLRAGKIKKAEWYLEALLLSFQEAQWFEFDKEGNISSVSVSVEQTKLSDAIKNSSLDYKYALQKRVNYYLKNSSKNFIEALPSYSIEEIDEPQKITKLSEIESDTHQETREAHETIESIAKTVDRSGKRGEIVFDRDNQTLTSWGNTVSIDVNNRMIENLGIENMTLKQLVWTANLINWFVHWRKENPYEKTGRLYQTNKGTIAVDNGFFYDTEVLTHKSIKRHYPHLYTDNKRINQNFMDYINSI